MKYDPLPAAAYHSLPCPCMRPTCIHSANTHTHTYTRRSSSTALKRQTNESDGGVGSGTGSALTYRNCCVACAALVHLFSKSVCRCACARYGRFFNVTVVFFFSLIHRSIILYSIFILMNVLCAARLGRRHTCNIRCAHVL